MSDFIKGYVGVMDFSAVTYENGPSMYALSDRSKSVLILIPLNFNFYQEAYQIAKNPSYIEVYIMIPELNDYVISDLYLFCTMLAKLKGIMHIHWMHPAAMVAHASMRMMYNADVDIHFNNMGAGVHFDLDPYIRFVPTGVMHSYDIFIWDGEYKHVFTNQFTPTLAESVAKEDNTVLHVPYITEFHESINPIISGGDIFTQSYIPLDRVSVHSYPNAETWTDIANKYKLHRERSVYDALI